MFKMTDFLLELKLEEMGTTAEIRRVTKELQNHELYYSIRTIEDVRTYMKFQVWCVWDFMTLVKSIQSKLISSSVIWLPPKDASVGAYIYEILLTEETDINHTADGRASHFETYLLAMDQAGANTTPIRTFISALESGVPFDQAIDEADIPLQARQFSETTVSHARSALHIVVSVFCLSREGIIPNMFTTFLNNFAIKEDLSIFKWYLNRHITIDNDTHGPLSAKLFKTVIGADNLKLKEALDAALIALEARKCFLDAMLNEIRVTNKIM
jgi:hypothetical protein